MYGPSSAGSLRDQQPWQLTTSNPPSLVSYQPWGEHTAWGAWLCSPPPEHQWLEKHFPNKQKQMETCPHTFCIISKWGTSSKHHVCRKLASSAKFHPLTCFISAKVFCTAGFSARLSHWVPFLPGSESRWEITKQRIKLEWVEVSETWGMPCWPRVSNARCSAEVGLFVHIISNVPVRWNLRFLIQLIFLANCWPIAVYSGFF